MLDSLWFFIRNISVHNFEGYLMSYIFISVWKGYYSDIDSECRVYHICKIENDLVDIKGGKIGPIMSTETFLCPVGSRFDMKERECKSRWVNMSWSER